MDVSAIVAFEYLIKAMYYIARGNDAAAAVQLKKLSVFISWIQDNRFTALDRKLLPHIKRFIDSLEEPVK